MQPLHTKRRQRQEFPPPLSAFLMSIEIGAVRDAFMGHTQAAGQGREGGSPIASLDHACRTLSAIRKRAIVHWNSKSRDEAQAISTADLPESFPFGPCLNLYRSLIGRTKDGYVTGWDTGAGASSFLRSHAGIGFSSGLEQWTTFISTSNSTAKTSFRLVLFSFYALLEQSVPLPCAAPVGRYKHARREGGLHPDIGLPPRSADCFGHPSATHRPPIWPRTPSGSLA